MGEKPPGDFGPQQSTEIRSFEDILLVLSYLSTRSKAERKISAANFLATVGQYRSLVSDILATMIRYRDEGTNDSYVDFLKTHYQGGIADNLIAFLEHELPARPMLELYQKNIRNISIPNKRFVMRYGYDTGIQVHQSILGILDSLGGHPPLYIGTRVWYRPHFGSQKLSEGKPVEAVIGDFDLAEENCIIIYENSGDPDKQVRRHVALAEISLP